MKFQFCRPRLSIRLLVLLCISLLQAGSALAATRTALVIGNSAYPFGPLLNPANDAKLMSETLKKTGFDVVTVLDADRQSMQKALVDFSREIRTKDTVGLFYFAGHGAQVNGANYLIPVDADIKSESEVKIFAINVDEFVATLERADGRTNIVILDSCRNNPFGAGTRSVNRGMALPDAPAGTFVALSTSPGAVALDGEGNNSPYAEALAKSMLQPDVSIEQAFKVTRRLVLESTKQKQVPWETSSLTGDFYFMPKTSAESTSSEPATPEVLPVAEAVPAPAPKAVEEQQVAVADPPPLTDAERNQEVSPEQEPEPKPIAKRVNSANVTVAKYKDGRFEKTSDTEWKEFNAEGKATYTFQEVSRNDTTVVLDDPSRKMQIYLEMPWRMIRFSQTGGQKIDLYPMTEVLALDEPLSAQPDAEATSNYRIIATDPKALPVGKWPEGIVITNNAIYVAESGSRRIVKIEPGTGDLLETYPSGRLPVNLTADPAGNVYAAVLTDGKIFKQPPDGKGKAIASVARPSYIQGLGFGNGAVYFTSYDEAGNRQTVLSRIDPKTGKTINASPAGAEPRAFVMAQDSPWVLDASGMVTMYDKDSLLPKDSIANDGFLWSMGANLDAVFVGAREQQVEGKSVVYRYAQGNPQDRISVTLDSNELIIAITANNDRVAALGVDGTYWILDSISLKPLKRINTGRRPQFALFENGDLYVTTHSWQGENGAVLVYEGLGKLD